MPRVRPGRYALGMAGVALVRHWLRADPAQEAERVADVARLVEDPVGMELDVPELESVPGYAAWAASYDAAPNPLIQIEEPVVRELASAVPPGDALDAACGTGRHTGWLAARGHRVVGVDASPAMLAAARVKHSGIEFREGALTGLPMSAVSVDLAVCALALMHVADVVAAFCELARVLRRGGRLVVSDLHPTMILLGGGALFEASPGSFAIVRNYPRGVGDYVTAAVSAGFAVRRCLEPLWGAEQIPLVAGPLYVLAPDTFRAALEGVPGALVLELERT